MILLTTIICIFSLTSSVANAAKTKSSDNEISLISTDNTKFTVDIKKAKLAIPNGKNKGNYKFKVIKKSHDVYSLKANGKKFAKQDRIKVTVEASKFTISYGKNNLDYPISNLDSNKSKSSTSVASNQQVNTNTQQTNNSNNQTDATSNGQDKQSDTTSNDKNNNTQSNGAIYGDPNQLDNNGQTAYQANPEYAGENNTYTFMTGGGYWETRQSGN